MVKVECDGCKAPYQIDEKRIPAAGLEMRCPKCGTNLLVTKPGSAAGDADLPAAKPAAPGGGPPRPAAPRPPPPPRPAAKAPPPPPAFGEIEAGFGEIGLDVDLPSPAGAPLEDDLPAVRGAPSPYAAPIPMGAAAAFHGGAASGPAPWAPAEPAFGEVDLPALQNDHADLPVAAGAPPVRPRGAPPPVPARPLAAPPPPAFAPAADPFTMGDPQRVPQAPPGFSDLPSPAGAIDFPMPAAQAGRRNPTVNFGDIDLPVAPDVGLPAPVPQGRRTVNLGDIDLPSAAPAGLPAPASGAPRVVRGRTVNFGDIDLPSVPDDLPAASPGGFGGGGFGELDLPDLAGNGLPAPAGVGLPAPAYGAGLPAPAYGVGLPAPAYGAGLPAPAYGAGLPAPAQAGFPAPAYGAGLPMAAHGQGLPMAAHGQGLPMAMPGGGLPMSAQGHGLPMAMPGGGLPMPAHGQGLPMAVPGGGLPMPAQGHGLPMAVPGGGLPMPAQGQGLPMTADVGYPEYQGFGAEAPIGRSNAFDDSDRAVPGQMGAGGASMGSVGIDLEGARAAVGDEADLAASPGPAADGAVPSQRRAKEPAAPARRGNGRKVALFAAVAAALTGGAFSLVPTVGPFGVYFVGDRLNAKSNAAALETLRQDLDGQLDEDTFAAVSGAIDRCQAAQASMPRFSPVAARCASVTLERGLRFGRRTEDEALAKQLLTRASDPTLDDAVLASAALDLLAGQVVQARGPVNTLRQKDPQDVDVAVVAGDVELADKAAAKAAVEAWKAAVSLRKGARTLYGLARALLAAGDPKGAEKTARDALLASKNHAGARTLIATVIGSDTAHEAEALDLLKQVTDGGDVTKAAAESELVDALTATGHIHLGRSRMSAAAQAFGAAVKLNPLAVRAAIGNGEVFFRSARFSEALARFEAASQADPENIVAKVGVAKTYISLERMKEAKDMLKRLKETKPNEPLVILWLGKAEEALGNKKEAEAAYTEAIKVGQNRPEVVDAYVALAHVLSAIGRSEDAQARLNEASKKFPDFPALHRARGEVALQMGRYEEAKHELEAALGHNEDLGARFSLGIVERRLRRFDDAGASFDKVAAVDPDFPGLALERGLLFQDTGKSDLALEAYRKALEKAPNDIDLKLRVGSTQVIAGHASEAVKVLEEVRKARPNSAEANHFLGRALLATSQNLVEAMRYLELAANIDSNRAEYFLYIGWAANELNQPGKATPALNRAIELNADLGDAYWQRGVTLQRQAEIQDALRDLNTALVKRPSRFEAWATIALCQEDMQRWPEAEKSWRSAIAGNGEVAEWHYRLGKLLDSHGNKTAAQPELEKALELANRPDEPKHLWLYDLHFLLAEALHRSPANKARTIEEYQHFLELAPPGLAYREDARKALVGMGVRVDR